jgi:hypothetical protein
MRGGPGRGQGRKPGGSNRKSRELAEKAIGEGSTPLEVMIRNMRFYDEEAVRLVSQLAAAAAAGTLPVDEAEGDEEAEVHESGLNADTVEQLRIIFNMRKMAGEAARDAAPYIHPRVGADTGEGGVDPDFVPLAERLKEYQRRDDLAAAGGNVVELKPSGDQ